MSPGVGIELDNPSLSAAPPTGTPLPRPPAHHPLDASALAEGGAARPPAPSHSALGASGASPVQTPLPGLPKPSPAEMSESQAVIARQPKPKRVITVGQVVAVFLFIASIAALVWYFMPTKVPATMLPTNEQDERDVMGITGDRTGVLLYISPTPGNAHIKMLEYADGTVIKMADSKKYDVRIAFGTTELADAEEATAEMRSIVFLDPGKEFAEELGVDYSAIVFFKPDGTIVRQIDEAFLKTEVDVDDHFDVLLAE